MKIYNKPELELYSAGNSDIITESIPTNVETSIVGGDSGIWSDITDEG